MNDEYCIIFNNKNKVSSEKLGSEIYRKNDINDTAKLAAKRAITGFFDLLSFFISIPYYYVDKTTIYPI